MSKGPPASAVGVASCSWYVTRFAMEYLDHTRRIRFPAPHLANEWGMVAQGGNLSPGIVLSAYEQGIFPWYEEPPIIWFSPDPRFILRLSDFRLGKRLKRTVRNGTFHVTMDHAFPLVIHTCRALRLDGEGTWITHDMERAYCDLHDLGYTHSVEVWRGDDLVGGLYGLGVDGMFAGESMFTLASDAGKVALVALVGFIDALGLPVIDCQSYTDNLARFGAVEVPRSEFLSHLSGGRSGAELPVSWRDVDGDAMVRRGLKRAEENARGV